MLATIGPFGSVHQVPHRVEAEADPKSGPRASSGPLAQRDRVPGLLLALGQANAFSSAQLNELMTASDGDERRLATRIVAAGIATENQLAQIVSQQLSVPWVSLRHVRVCVEALSLVPRVLAEELCLFPLFFRRARPSKLLYLAIDDPTDEDALLRVSEWSDLPVRAMVATPTAIRSAIRDCYPSSGSSALLVDP